jgi:sugar lactone lactonase YvrE
MSRCNFFVRLYAYLILSRLLTGTLLASPPTIDINFNPTSVRPSSSFAATISTINFTDQIYFDVRFRMPGSGVDQVALNWQRGASAIHDVPADAAAGFWLITGIRAHETEDDHEADFVPLAATLTVEQFPELMMTVAGDGRADFRGDGGSATLASLSFPGSVAVDGSGNLYIADLRNQRIRKLTRDGIITTVAGNGQTGFSGDGGLAVRASLNLMGAIWTQYTGSVAVDSAGNIYIADTNNNRIRRVTPNGVIATFAGSGTRGFSGDGGSALQAALAGPGAIAFDSLGNMFIADTGNNAIRKVKPDGTISTYVSGQRIVWPVGVAVDTAGNIYIAAGPDGLVKMSPAGELAALQGDWAVPWGLAADPAGNVYIADSHNQRIKKVSADGNVSTLAGIGELDDPHWEVVPPGYSGDGGLAVNAALGFPLGVAVDGFGSLYIADTWNNRIRKIGAQ